MNNSEFRKNEVSFLDPIFLGGLDRTGKTLMRLMLTSHSNIAITRRTYLWSKYYKKFGDLKHVENFNCCLDAMLKSKSIQFLEPDEELIRREFWLGEATYPRLFAIIQMQFAQKMGRTRWGDQMGMIELFADPIFLAYPGAKIIHMIRDPRERYKEKFANHKTKPGKFGWETERWLNSIRIANRNLKHYPHDYKIVRYESFMSNPENTIEEVCEFINETFEHGMITMENAIRFGNKPVEINDYSIRVDSKSSQNNKGDGLILSNRKVAYIQSSASRELQRHDYSLEDTKFSVMDWIKYSFVDWPINYTGGLACKYSTSNSWNIQALT